MSSFSNMKPIDDVRKLGYPKIFVLGIQHLFAMFGATILVPVLTGLPVSTALIFSGIGTLFFHSITRMHVPIYLGSSFAFIGGYLTVKTAGMNMGMSDVLALDYACIGVLGAALFYFLLAALVKFYGVQKVLRFFPPIVTGPIVIAIGLVLSGSAIEHCQENWLVAFTAFAAIIVANIWGRGFFRIIPVFIGVICSYVVAVCLGEVDFSSVEQAPWIYWPFSDSSTVLAVFEEPDYAFMVSAILTVAPIAIATIVEHIGDMCAVSSTVDKNFLEKPGLHRTLVGNGVATFVAAFFGAPANTPYSENTGVLNLTRVYDSMVIRLAAIFAIVLSFCPKFAELICIMPLATIGGASLILYGMISSIGVRNLVDAKSDFGSARNIIIVAAILVLAIGIKYGADDQLQIGRFSFSGLAVAAVVGVILNIVLPRNHNGGEEQETKPQEGKI